MSCTEVSTDSPAPEKEAGIFFKVSHHHQYEKDKVISNMTNQSGIKLEINYTQKSGKFTDMERLNNNGSKNKSKEK